LKKKSSGETFKNVFWRKNQAEKSPKMFFGEKIKRRNLQKWFFKKKSSGETSKNGFSRKNRAKVIFKNSFSDVRLASCESNL
jgi:hypothetical protein